MNSLTKHEREYLKQEAQKALSLNKALVSTRPQYIISLAEEVDELEEALKDVDNRLVWLEDENTTLRQDLEEIRGKQ